MIEKGGGAWRAAICIAGLGIAWLFAWLIDEPWF
jgi:hypothetical protein